MMLRRWWLPLFLLFVPCGASAQEVSEKQVEALIRSGEQLLLAGQPRQALEKTRKLSAIFLGEGATNYTDYMRLWNRGLVVSITALVRLDGRDPTDPESPPRKNLERAEQRFAELLGPEPAPPAQPAGNSCNCSEGSAKVPVKPALWRSRYGEALVALGRYQEAFHVLSALFVSSTLNEAEGAAALARAAAELSNEQMAGAADARCRVLAKKRAKSVCRVLPKPRAAR